MTRNTLHFACDAKKVANNAKVNSVISDTTLIEKYAQEIKNLKSILKKASRKQGVMLNCCAACKRESGNFFFFWWLWNTCLFAEEYIAT